MLKGLPIREKGKLTLSSLSAALAPSGESLTVDVPEPGRLNLAALMIYEQVKKNLTRPKRAFWVRGMNFTVQVRASKMCFYVTKKNRTITLHNGEAPRPDATLTLRKVRFWGNPAQVLLRREIRTRGNRLTLLRFLFFLTP